MVEGGNVYVRAILPFTVGGTLMSTSTSLERKKDGPQLRELEVSK
jgi:hypothetical protein